MARTVLHHGLDNFVLETQIKEEAHETIEDPIAPANITISMLMDLLKCIDIER